MSNILPPYCDDVAIVYLYLFYEMDYSRFKQVCVQFSNILKVLQFVIGIGAVDDGYTVNLVILFH